MHNVILFFSGILTISTIEPDSSLIKYFIVPSGDLCISSISGGNNTAKDLSFDLNCLLKSDICSKSRTPF